MLSSKRCSPRQSRIASRHWSSHMKLCYKLWLLTLPTKTKACSSRWTNSNVKQASEMRKELRILITRNSFSQWTRTSWFNCLSRPRATIRRLTCSLHPTYFPNRIPLRIIESKVFWDQASHCYKNIRLIQSSLRPTGVGRQLMQKNRRILRYLRSSWTSTL